MSGLRTLSTPDVLVPATAEVGEGPVTDARTGRLCWVDLTRGGLYENDLLTGRQLHASFDTLLGAVAPRAHVTGFAAAVSDGFGIIDDGRLVVSDRVLPEPYRRMNDAKCDSHGRLWAGSTHMEGLPGLGSLHRWDGTSPSAVVDSGLALPNGIGWSPDDRTMYLADSLAHSLSCAEFDAEDGVVAEFRVLTTFGAALPDGLAVDADGFIWIAIWGGWQVRRYSPTGELVAEVPMPVSQPTSCAFDTGGTLVITSASAGLSDADRRLQPHAGSVFALSTSTTGVPVSPFRA